MSIVGASPEPGPQPLAAPEAAEAAGLRYVSDAQPGIRRRRSGKGFSYRAPDGATVRDRETLERVRALAIPPAWTEVWICPDPQGHVQATGRDARGRKQYRYHRRWREVRDATKFDRLVAFGAQLPAIRRRVDQDLARPGLPRDKVLATVVRLLETTAARVGNEEYRRHNRSYGLTTLRDHHVDLRGATMRFAFRGKSGKMHQAEVTDRRLAAVVRRCQEIPGHELFQYLDGEGRPQSVGSGDVNAYLRQIAGSDLTAKDFRTWSGSVLALRALAASGPASTLGAAQKNVLAAIDEVSAQLGNTRAVCRKFYVHPALVEEYVEGRLDAALAARNGRSRPGLDRDETRLLALLERRAAGAPTLEDRLRASVAAARRRKRR